ncbi:MAG: SEL1-like repeat protein [Candidatus Methanomethylophilaceae archaeon]|jgi:TPR repeat protein|nr:SEL1-like repeat protein [Thermoplasmata archaeon]MBR3409843.1 SEL1-like repeat protein [Candidatus Methanomethylophilaceae archaeon]MBR3476019.1 SEL1-like repeat protein [Candidatus Methanomethylophilaceae archaeon]MBR6871278.1 SEL1-like repeat protein [Candidatus Methanomethylophilaceae archaeon]
MHQHGKGVQRSILSATEWYRKALKNGVEAAEDRLKELGAL